MPSEHLEAEQPAPIIAEIKGGPEKPIEDPQFVLKRIVRPWLERTEGLGTKLLEKQNPLVQALIERYGLPDADKYMSPDDESNPLWILAGHWINDGIGEGIEQIEKFGGVLGLPGVETFWSPQALEKHIAESVEDGDYHHQVMHVFVAPHRVIYFGCPQVKLSDFNPDLRSEDLPSYYVERALDGQFRQKRAELFKRSVIAPFDWRVALLRI